MKKESYLFIIANYKTLETRTVNVLNEIIKKILCDCLLAKLFEIRQISRRIDVTKRT